MQRSLVTGPKLVGMAILVVEAIAEMGLALVDARKVPRRDIHGSSIDTPKWCITVVMVEIFLLTVDNWRNC